MSDLLETLVRRAKEAHKDAKEYERGSCPNSYYRGLRRGFLSSARFVKLEIRHLEIVSH